MKNTESNIISFRPSSDRNDGGCSFPPLDRLKRVILTPKQFETHVSSRDDVTSKMNKPIYKQTKLLPVMHWLLDDVCRRSNGGAVAVGINQLDLRAKQVTPILKISQKSLKNALTNLLHYGMIVKVADSRMYEVGLPIIELLDPILINKIYQDEMDRRKKVVAIH